VAIGLGTVTVSIGLIFFVVLRDKPAGRAAPQASVDAKPAEPTVPAVASAKGDKSIAVLPFTNMSEEKDNASLPTASMRTS